MKIKQINDLIHQVKNFCFSTKSEKLYYTPYRGDDAITVYRFWKLYGNKILFDTICADLDYDELISDVKPEESTTTEESPTVKDLKRFLECFKDDCKWDVLGNDYYDTSRLIILPAIPEDLRKNIAELAIIITKKAVEYNISHQ
jgi:hypothetical protein